jgi:hypothetical protein
MQKVVVCGADGERVSLAFVRQEGRTVYVCAASRYGEVLGGSDAPLVGFSAEHVEGLDQVDAAHPDMANGSLGRLLNPPAPTPPVEDR